MIALQRLDSSRRMVLHSTKDTPRAIQADNFRLCGLEEIPQPIFADLVLNRLLDAIRDGPLYFTNADDAKPRLLCHPENDKTGEAMGLGRSASALEALVSDLLARNGLEVRR